jgi:gliding motility-associated-like protein
VSNLVSQFGCDSIVTTNVTALLNSSTQQYDTVCFGQNYIFPDGNILPSIIQNTVYNSIFTNSNGCDSIVETHLEVLPAPVSNFTFSPIIPTTLDNEVTFSPLSFVEQTYYWNIIDAENNELIFSNDSVLTFTFEPNFLSPFTICLNTESSNGCVSSVCQEITINSDVLVFVPNGFTPNNDKINDTFHPVIFSNQFENYEFEIFDRWGLLVFSSTIYTEGWDGTYKGEYAPIDTYTYKLYFKDKNSVNEHRFIGHVSLVR